MRASIPIKVLRREAKRSTSIVMSVRPTPAVHISLTVAEHALSHIEPMGSDFTQATGEAAPWTTSRPPLIGPSVRCLPAVAGTAVAGTAVVVEAVGSTAMSTMDVIGVADAATVRTMHARLNASATAAQRPRREKRATWTETGVDTREH